MAGIRWNDYKFKRLHDVWDALPDGFRLHIGIQTGSEVTAISRAISEARMLAFYNRFVLKVWQEDLDVVCIISRTDGCKLRQPYAVDCWNFHDWR